MNKIKFNTSPFMFWIYTLCVVSHRAFIIAMPVLTQYIIDAISTGNIHSLRLNRLAWFITVIFFMFFLSMANYVQECYENGKILLEKRKFLTRISNTPFLKFNDKITLGMVISISLYYSKLWSPMEFYLDYPKDKAKYITHKNRLTEALEDSAAGEKENENLFITDALSQINIVGLSYVIDGRQILDNANLRIDNCETHNVNKIHVQFTKLRLRFYMEGVCSE